MLGSLCRRVGAAAAAVVLVSAAPARADGAIEDRLIDRVDGFELRPESGVFGGGSGPMTAADMTSLLGVDRDDLPEEMSAYLRMFDAASGDVALVLGVSFLDTDDGRFLAGFAAAAEAQDEGTKLFTDEIGPLRHMAAYEVTQAGQTFVMTAFEAEQLGVVLGVTGSQTEALPTLRDMVQRHADLTHPRTTKPAPVEEESASYRAGEWFGRLIVVGLLAFAPVVTIVMVVQNRRRQRERRQRVAEGWVGPGPGYPPPWGAMPPPPPPPPPAPPPAVPVEPLPPSPWGPLDGP